MEVTLATSTRGFGGRLRVLGSFIDVWYCGQQMAALDFGRSRFWRIRPPRAAVRGLFTRYFGFPS